MELSSKKQIAVNTTLLYFRTIILMFISLFTSRVILNALGVEDFGTYNAVAGVVSMLSLVTGPLGGAISRYITFELGMGREKGLQQVFSTSFVIIVLLSIACFIFFEITAVWFLENKMVIPCGREEAAKWVLQFSILSFMINLFIVPYNASVIAFEKMSVFAYIGIGDSILKLIIAFLIMYTGYDKLVLYSFLLALVSLCNFIIYYIYCRYKLNSLNFSFNAIDRHAFRGMFAFAGWQLFGGAATVLRIQGINILFNIFGGPIVNAAQGIANQVNSAVSSFVMNFTTALNPSIIKSYASKQYHYMNELVYQGSKFSYYLTLFFILPLTIETKQILYLWLGQVPEHTIAFVRLILFYTLIESLSKSLITGINATGMIKYYQIIVGLLVILNLPINYILLKMGLQVEIALCVSISLELIAFGFRLYLSHKLYGFQTISYIQSVLLRVTIVSLIALVAPLCIYLFNQPSAFRLCATTLVSFFSCSLSVYYVGLKKGERSIITSKIKMLCKKK